MPLFVQEQKSNKSPSPVDQIRCVKETIPCLWSSQCQCLTSYVGHKGRVAVYVVTESDQFRKSLKTKSGLKPKKVFTKDLNWRKDKKPNDLQYLTKRNNGKDSEDGSASH